jgi:thiol-disulfide isomerase/thioredoxin
MNRWAKIGIIGLVVLILGYMVVNIATHLYQKEQIKEQRQSLPDFTFYTFDSTQVTSRQLPDDRPIVIVYFNPECDKCIYQWEVIENNTEKLSHLYFVLVSSVALEPLKQFAKEKEIEQYDNIQVLMDYEEEFFNYFGSNTYPSLFIYNRSWELVKQYTGETKAEAILKPLSESS